jgi:hypothetical protein
MDGTTGAGAGDEDGPAVVGEGFGPVELDPGAAGGGASLPASAGPPDVDGAGAWLACDVGGGPVVVGRVVVVFDELSLSTFSATKTTTKATRTTTKSFPDRRRRGGCISTRRVGLSEERLSISTGSRPYIPRRMDWFAVR